ncbi:hypothetical protein J6590_088331, partial [Homalodisca vitripennis]
MYCEATEIKGRQACITEIRKVTGFITGHWIFRSHLNRIGIPVQETLCRKCGEADETAKH